MPDTRRMDEKRVRGKRVVRVDWDDTSRGEWHYVQISNLRIHSGSHLGPGGRVSLKHGSRIWTGTIAGKRARVLKFSKCHFTDFDVCE